MKTLRDGYERFRNGFWRDNRELYSTLARDGQSPPAMVIACADSRVAPETVFDCGPGDIFVVRNVAALVPPYAPDGAYHGTSSALEFAVTVLGVRTIAVMGHSRCGGIRALMAGPGNGHGDFISGWMDIARSARARVCDSPAADFETQCGACEHEAIRVSLANLLTFPWIAARVQAGTLELAGLHFDLASGQLEDVEPA
jgi:carbonic anhydrase